MPPQLPVPPPDARWRVERDFSRPEPTSHGRQYQQHQPQQPTGASTFDRLLQLEADNDMDSLVVHRSHSYSSTAPGAFGSDDDHRSMEEQESILFGQSRPQKQKHQQQNLQLPQHKEQSSAWSSFLGLFSWGGGSRSGYTEIPSSPADDGDDDGDSDASRYYEEDFDRDDDGHVSMEDGRRGRLGSENLDVSMTSSSSSFMDWLLGHEANPSAADAGFAGARPATAQAPLLGKESVAADADEDEIDDFDRPGYLLAGLFELTWETRILSFLACFVLGSVCSMIGSAYVPLIAVQPAHFALFFSVGNLLSLCSSGFLVGFSRQLESMFSPVRRTSSVVYLLSIVFTLLAAIWLRSTLLTLLGISVQSGAYLYYALSYVPYGRSALHRLLACLVDCSLCSPKGGWLPWGK